MRHRRNQRTFTGNYINSTEKCIRKQEETDLRTNVEDLQRRSRFFSTAQPCFVGICFTFAPEDVASQKQLEQYPIVDFARISCCGGRNVSFNYGVSRFMDIFWRRRAGVVTTHTLHLGVSGQTLTPPACFSSLRTGGRQPTSMAAGPSMAGGGIVGRARRVR